MIIIRGILRNTSNHLKLHEITLFPTGSSSYYQIIIIQFTKALSYHYTDVTWTSNAYHGLNFYLETWNFQTLFLIPERFWIKIKAHLQKIYQISYLYPPKFTTKFVLYITYYSLVFNQIKLQLKAGLFTSQKKEASIIQYGYKKCVTHTRLFSQTLSHRKAWIKYKGTEKEGNKGK